MGLTQQHDPRFERERLEYERAKAQLEGRVLASIPVLRMDDMGRAVAVHRIAEGRHGGIEMALDRDEFSRFMAQPWPRGNLRGKSNAA